MAGRDDVVRETASAEKKVYNSSQTCDIEKKSDMSKYLLESTLDIHRHNLVSKDRGHGHLLRWQVKPPFPSPKKSEIIFESSSLEHVSQRRLSYIIFRFLENACIAFQTFS